VQEAVDEARGLVDDLYSLEDEADRLAGRARRVGVGEDEPGEPGERRRGGPPGAMNDTDDDLLRKYDKLRAKIGEENWPHFIATMKWFIEEAESFGLTAEEYKTLLVRCGSE
jgi:hypothetical protein